jgi:hypothetical protein
MSSSGLAVGQQPPIAPEPPAPATAPIVAAVGAVAAARAWSSRRDSVAADALARHARMTAEEILELRRQGRGWAAIKRALGVSLPDVPAEEPAPVGRLDVIA